MNKCTQAQTKAALKDMLTFFGRPRRDEWMNEAAWKEAKQVCANAEAALTAAAEAGEQQIEEAFNDGYEDMRAQIPRIKSETIERCAQFAHDWLVLRGKDGSAEELSAAIRAMRERP